MKIFLAHFDPFHPLQVHCFFSEYTVNDNEAESENLLNEADDAVFMLYETFADGASKYEASQMFLPD